MEKKKVSVKLPSHGQTVCVFCGGSPLTEEHIFTNAIKNIIPRIWDKNTTQFFSEKSINSGIVQKGARTHSGHTGNQRLKIVCGPCNNGWMNRIEQEAIPIMAPLMLGHPAILNRKDQAIIAKWGVLKTIIAEYMDTPKKAIPTIDRKEFMETQTPPQGWKIWIARLQSITGELRCHHTGAISVPSSFRIGIDKAPEAYNTQYSIFCIQDLIIYTFRSTCEDKTCNFSGLLGQKMIQIFPSIYTEIDWKNMNILGQEGYKMLRASHII